MDDVLTSKNFRETGGTVAGSSRSGFFPSALPPADRSHNRTGRPAFVRRPNEDGEIYAGANILDVG